MAARDDYPVEALGSRLTCDDFPFSARALDPLDPGAEPDVACQVSLLGVRLEVREHVAVVEELRGRVGQREARVLHAST